METHGGRARIGQRVTCRNDKVNEIRGGRTGVRPVPGAVVCGSRDLVYVCM